MNWERSDNFEEWPGCFGCGHRRVGKRLYCAAYPEGIPQAIAFGEVDHLVSRPGQVGDTVFEPLDLQHWLNTRERRVLVEEADPGATPDAAHASRR